MKITNSTALAPGLEIILEKYSAPGWLIFFGGTAIVLAAILATVCYKFSKCSLWSYQTCGNCCKCCNGCLLGSAQNCTDCVNGYKSCVVNTFDCLTFAPRYIQAQRVVTNRTETVIQMQPALQLPVPQLPVVRVGFPDPFAQ